MRFPTFAAPEFLYLLPLALLVAGWWARRRRPAVRFSDLSLFAGAAGGRARRAVWGGAALRGMACAALVLACAGPRLPDERTRLPAEAVAVMMVMDVSDTMSGMVGWAPGEPPVTRLEAAQRAFRLFVAGGTAPDGTGFDPRPSDQVGLVAFASVPQTVCPLTLNHSVLLKIADGLRPKGGLDAGTNVGDAIAEALIRLEASKGPKTRVLILLSDGQHVQTKDAALKPRAAAQLAANLGYAIFTIDAGPDPAPDAPPDDERRQGREILRQVAEMTGGRAFTATAGADMRAAYKQIDGLARSPVAAYQYRRYFEFYGWCAAAAVVFLLVAHVLDRTAWRTVP
jgi:Ca-activated chloride channel family protein